jgi:hypothetical protein
MGPKSYGDISAAVLCQSRKWDAEETVINLL